MSLFVPLKGVSLIDTEGQPFYAPEADEALFGALRENLDEKVELVEMETDINDPKFATAMAQRLHEHYQGRDREGARR